VSTTIPQLPSPAALEVGPGDEEAATAVEAWLGEYATSRDPVLRQQIILAYLGLADRLADRYRHSRGTTPEDLTQTARAGLIAAIDRYDPAKGPVFLPYAVACVVGELKRHLRDTNCWRLHVPRTQKERALRLCRRADELHKQLGRSPTTIELAEQLQVSEAEVLEGLAAMSSRREVSLDQPIGEDAGACLGDLVAAPGPGRSQKTCWSCPTCWPPSPVWSARSLSCGSSRTWTSTRSRPWSGSPRCTSRGSSAAPWPACMPN
jgi:RNA polymerase sigma factor (sigma-70 family)